MMRNISPSHRILLVEDNPGDVRLIQEYLTGAQGLRTQMECAGTLSQALEIIPSFVPDLVLLDLGLPDSEGLNGLRRIQARAPLTPVVILTGLDDQELGGQAVSQGAQDYLLKGDVNGPILRRVITYAIERMGAWRAVQESEAKYLDLYENAPEMLASVDPDTGTILECNATLANAVGCSREDLVGTPALALYHPDCHEKAQAVFEEFRRSGRANGEELLLETRSGGRVHVSLNVTAFRDAEGGIVFNRSSLRDITEKKEAEEAVAAAAAQLRLLNLTLEEGVRARTEELDKANQELGAFAYSVSHDLRAPLRAIDGFSGILAEEYGGVLDAEGNRLLAVVRENTGRMGKLIEDLLEFSRVGRKPMSRRPVDMEGLVRSVVEELSPWSGNVGGEGNERGEIIIGPLPPAHGDAALLKQVWINLLANAAKFSRGREAPTIRVEGQEEEGTAVYSVTDNGVGFDMAYSNKLFGVFERLHRADEFEGTGVGLALVSRIVERHGGKIWGEGAVDRGATFWFTLPHTEGEDA